MPVLCLGCQSYSVTASLFCHILPQRHIQNNHREQVPAPKNWFQRHKVLEVVEHRVVWFPNPLAAGSHDGQMGAMSSPRQASDSIAASLYILRRGALSTRGL